MNSTYAPLKLVVPNQMGYLPIVLKTVEELCYQQGFDESTIRSVVLACEEAIANVILHAFSPDEEAEFTIQIEPSTTGIAFHVLDKGMPYDPGSETFDEETLRGLGHLMMGRLMDRVQFHNHGNRGKELVLHKYFSQDELVTEKLKRPEVVENQVKQFLLEEIEYRLFQPQDALEIARCAYESYGYTYAYEHIYYPERIRELNERGELISLVATCGEQVLGHVGLVKFEGVSGVYELGLAMTKQGYRGLHIFSTLAALVLAEARKRGIMAIFGQFVTTHIYSQKAPLRIGMRPTALLCAYVPSDIDFRKIKKSMGQRSAVLVMTRVLAERGVVRIFVPQTHRPMLQRIYDEMGQAVEFAESDIVPAQLSETSLSINANMRMGKLFFQRMGVDIDQHLRNHVMQARKEDVQMIEAFVNMCLPDAPGLIAAAERYGFAVVGVLPGALEGDLLVLQYFNGVHVQFFDIELVPEGSFLLPYIQNTINP